MEEKISIIVPIYNAESFIRQTVRSVLQQTYVNFELILVDDCSADGSSLILEELCREDHRIRVITHKVNSGVSASRNTGISNSTAPYIFFLDADDSLYNKESLEILKRGMDVDSDFSFGGTYFVENGIPKSNHYHRLKNRNSAYTGSEVFQSFLNKEWASVVWNKLYRTDFIKSNNLQFAEGLLHEDELWCFQAAFFAKKINFVDSPTYVYNYLLNPSSIINSGGEKNYIDMKEILFIMVRMTNEFMIHEQFPAVIKYLESFAQYSILNHLISNSQLWKKVYSEIRAEFARYSFSNQKFFKKPASVAYLAYRAKFDKNFALYKKLPAVFSRLL